MALRTCTNCGTNNPGAQWYAGPICTKCYQQQRYMHNGGSKRFGVHARFARGRRKAEEREIVWNITLSEYIDLIQKPCFYCGKSLSEQTGHSLDRVYASEGYILQNVLPCCGDCNTIKSNLLTVDETFAVIKLIKQLRHMNESPWKKRRPRKDDVEAMPYAQYVAQGARCLITADRKFK